MDSPTTFTNSGSVMSAIKSSTEAFHKRLHHLYPCVEDVTQLPHAWSLESKAPPLGLTYDNLGCYFRGSSRREEDDKLAAAVRTDQPIPVSSLLYYFEIKIISKGREGYMGIGLTSGSVILTKLPGWTRESYGYHADDGQVFNGDGRGLGFGPTYTTGDVIGCGYNLVEGECFFTKNGIMVGSAFRGVPSYIQFYPTVGLKTPGEEIKANFGQEEFVYDIEQDLKSLRKNMTLTISNYPISDFESWQTTLHKLVQSWLLQNSYPNTADAFTRSTNLEYPENMHKVQQRNKIQQCVLNGRISEAIRLTNRLCPNLLRTNPNLLFALRCRQFIELIGGADDDYLPPFNNSNIFENINNTNNRLQHHTTTTIATSDSATAPPPPPSSSQPPNGESPLDHLKEFSLENSNNNNSNNGYNRVTSSDNGDKLDNQQSGSSSSLQELMEIDQPFSFSSTTNTNIINDDNNHLQSCSPTNSNKNNHSSQSQSSSNLYKTTTPANLNGNDSLDLENDQNVNSEEKCLKLLQFGKDLNELLQQLNKLYGKNETNEKMLRDAISLIAFSNPKSSCLGKLLDPSEREPVSQLLNKSILKTEMDDMYRCPLEEVMNHLKTLIRRNGFQGGWLVDQLYY